MRRFCLSVLLGSCLVTPGCFVCFKTCHGPSRSYSKSRCAFAADEPRADVARASPARTI